MTDTTRQDRLFPRVTDEHLQTLGQYGTEINVSPGQIIFQEGEPADTFYAVLEGEIRITKQVAGGDQLLTVHAPGEFTGEIALLTGEACIATGRAVTSGRLLKIEANLLQKALADHPAIAGIILSAMAQRRPEAEDLTRQREKMAALGMMAAGLAHELNNPASAARSAASQLEEAFQKQQERALQLCQVGVSEQQHEAVAAFMATAAQRLAQAEELDPLTQSDREEALIEWFDAHDVDNGWELAPTFVSAGLTVEELEAVARQIAPEALCDTLEWCESTLSVKELLQEIENSTVRITEIVKAVKEYSYMDQAPLQEIAIHAGIENTLTILNHKLRKHQVTVEREFDPELPPICAFGSELNQVWTNLLDNAIDALQEQTGPRVIRISTAHKADSVQVVISDNGPGIPSEIQSRIFEPFYTTKSVGQGTGLGLDIAYRIVVLRHQGDIRVDSEAGGARFEVCLPIKPEPIMHDPAR